MPLFDYQCRDCDRAFEAFVTANRAPECPACRGSNLVKMLSSPGMVGASDGGRRAEPMPMAGGCGAGGASCACRFNS